MPHPVKIARDAQMNELRGKVALDMGASMGSRDGLPYLQHVTV